jgi:hypothetical protein
VNVILAGGTMMAEVKALFFLPEADNDGRILKAEIEEVRQTVYTLCDGWTFLGYVKGAFRMADGSQALDDSQAYVVVIEETDIPLLEQILRDFKAKTTQEAIYLEIQHHVEVRFI